MISIIRMAAAVSLSVLGLGLGAVSALKGDITGAVVILVLTQGLSLMILPETT